MAEIDYKRRCVTPSTRNGEKRMSKGNPIYTVRIGPELSNAIEKDLENRRNSNGREDLSFGEWIRLAIVEKLEHMKRGRKRGRKIAKMIRAHQEADNTPG